MRKPKWFFVPSETVIHPETREPVLEAGVAYSTRAFYSKCAATGIDNAAGALIDLECARAWRRDNKISRFVILKAEDK